MIVKIKSQFIQISDIVNGQLVKYKYIGYTIKEAKRKFKTTNHQDTPGV